MNVTPQAISVLRDVLEVKRSTDCNSQSCNYMILLSKKILDVNQNVVLYRACTQCEVLCAAKCYIMMKIKKKYKINYGCGLNGSFRLLDKHCINTAYVYFEYLAYFFLAQTGKTSVRNEIAIV